MILQKDFSDKAQAEIYTVFSGYVDPNKKFTHLLCLEFIVRYNWTISNTK